MKESSRIVFYLFFKRWIVWIQANMHFINNVFIQNIHTCNNFYAILSFEWKLLIWLSKYINNSKLICYFASHRLENSFCMLLYMCKMIAALSIEFVHEIFYTQNIHKLIKFHKLNSSQSNLINENVCSNEFDKQPKKPSQNVIRQRLFWKKL